MGRSKSTAKIAELLALELPDDREALGEMPIPEASQLYHTDVEGVEAVAEHFGALWVRLAREDFGGGEWFWDALQAVGLYFGCSLFELAIKARPATALEVLRKFDNALTAEDVAYSSVEAHLQRSQAEELLGSFAFCASKLLFAADIDQMEVQLGQLTEKYDADLTAISALQTYHEEIDGLDAEPLALANELLARSFEFRERTVRDRFKRWSRLRGTLPQIGIPELTLISARDKAMEEKYGAKKIERVFEQKLWVIFTALGFTVVAARPGEAVADLLCISERGKRPEHHFSFLVDAKSSRDPYKLPKADQRAIADYARAMPDLKPRVPPLAFVLIVGSGCADTVPQRMRDLEEEIGVPVRFVRADLVALLHQVLAAPVPPQTFLKAVRRSPPELTEEIVEELKNAMDAAVSKFADYVRDFRLLEL